MKSKRTQAYVDLLIVTAIWGFAGPVIKYTLPDFPPFIFLTYRFLISIIFFIPFIFFKKTKLSKKPRDIIFLIIAALFGSSVNLGLLFYGYDLTSVLDATILSATAPLIVVSAGALFLKEKITNREKVGLIIAFLGSVAIVFEPIASGKLFAFENIYGNILIISANIAWTAYVVLSKYELNKKADPFTITFLMFLVGFLTLLPFAIFEKGGIQPLILSISKAPFTSHLGVWYMALLSGNLAYFLYQKGQKNIEASEAAVFTYLTPLFAAPLAIFWLGEKITIPFVVASVILSMGVYIAESKKKLPSK